MLKLWGHIVATQLPAEDKKEDLVSAVIALQTGFNYILNLWGLYQVRKIITLTVNGIFQVDLLQKLASQFKPVQMAFRKQPVTKPLITCSGWKLHLGAKKNSVTPHFVNLIFSKFYRTTSLPGKLVARWDLELSRVSAGEKKKFSSEEFFFSNMLAHTILAEKSIISSLKSPHHSSWTFQPDDPCSYLFF